MASALISATVCARRSWRRVGLRACVLTTSPMPAPGQGQLLVQVEATGISYAEQAVRRARYLGQPAFPPPRATTWSAASCRSGVAVTGSWPGGGWPR